MCGICGQLHFDRNRPADPDRVRRMTGRMVHRGPDDEGTYFDGPLGFGFRRLSIIDVAGGHQPMSDEAGRVWVVFNGEIYNFPELRDELTARGYTFRTRSDTEVIVHGYRAWGLDVLERLNGMFGLAIWDRDRQRLTVARDRAGIKMIYYRIADGTLTFASEARPVLAACPEIAGQPDPLALYQFLRYRYTPSPLTAFGGLRKLAPGARLVVENGAAREERWWRFEPEPFDPPPPEAEAEEALYALYQRAVKRHLLSDVPLGLLLSGGLDSGLLLALMNQQGRGWKTFTVGYGGGYAGDEIVAAARTAEMLHSDHAAVTLDQAAFQDALGQVISLVEEPIASASVVPMYHVSQRARQDVKVALMGQGPDELFGGYRRHLGVYYGRYWRALPGPLRAAAKRMLRALPRNESAQRALYSLDAPDRLERYAQVFSILPGEQMARFFQDGLLPPDSERHLPEPWRAFQPAIQKLGELRGFQFLEIRSSLPDELLMYADKLSMAHSLEVRVPFLDRDIIEYVERLPDRYSLRRFHSKWLHRRLCRKHLPAEWLARPKQGFAGDVVDDWFRHSLSGRLEEVFRDDASALYRYLKKEPVRQLLREHQAGRHDHHKILFSMVVMDEWLRNFG
jgi:asparagine synthase (glutamine-hydrolysing)